MNQYAVELHSHTQHSDGDFTVEELYNQAITYGYDGLILTDHNTTSGYKDLDEKASNSSLVTLSGIEWTTYYGHMLVHDAERLIDWRTATPHTIDEHIQEVKDANGLVGIAHPFAVGSPICTGCHWSFNVKKWENVDYIEIWNSTCPDDHFWSREAYRLWVELLNKGYKMSCSAGRDWHRIEGENKNYALTYIETEGHLTKKRFRDSLEKGLFYITLGPKINWHLNQDGRRYKMGDTIRSGEAALYFEPSDDMSTFLRRFSPMMQYIKVYNNDSLIKEEAISGFESFSLNLEKGYIRIEVWGKIKGKEHQLLVISNPIYIE